MSSGIQFWKGNSLTHTKSTLFIVSQKLSPKHSERPFYWVEWISFSGQGFHSSPRHSTKTGKDNLHQSFYLGYCQKEMIHSWECQKKKKTRKKKEKSLGFHRGISSLRGVMKKEGWACPQNKQKRDGPLWWQKGPYHLSCSLVRLLWALFSARPVYGLLTRVTRTRTHQFSSALPTLDS